MSSSLKSKAVRKVAAVTAKHSARSTASKLKRSPMKASVLLAIGCVAGFLAGRLSASNPA
jgi:hypothetical protein